MHWKCMAVGFASHINMPLFKVDFSKPDLGEVVYSENTAQFGEIVPILVSQVYMAMLKCMIENNHDQCTHGMNIIYPTVFETTICVFAKSLAPSITSIFCEVVCIPWHWIYMWFSEMQKARFKKKWMYYCLIYPDDLRNTREKLRN